MQQTLKIHFRVSVSHPLAPHSSHPFISFTSFDALFLFYAVLYICFSPYDSRSLYGSLYALAVATASFVNLFALLYSVIFFVVLIGSQRFFVSFFLSFFVRASLTFFSLPSFYSSCSQLSRCFFQYFLDHYSQGHSIILRPVLGSLCTYNHPIQYLGLQLLPLCFLFQSCPPNPLLAQLFLGLLSHTSPYLYDFLISDLILKRTIFIT